MYNKRRLSVLVLLLLLVAVGVALFLLYLRLPTLLATYGVQYLDHYGVESIETTQPQLGYGTVNIPLLSLRGRNDSVGFDFKLEDVEVSYDVASLATGELSELSVDRVVLTLDVGPSPSSGPGPALRLSELLPARVEELLPVGVLSVGHFILHLERDGQPLLEGQGRVTIDQILQLELDAQWQGLRIAVAIDVGQSPTNMVISLSADLEEKRLAQVNARSKLSASPAWSWQADLELDIEPLSAWLSTPSVADVLPVDFTSRQYLEQLEPTGSVSFKGSLTHADTSDFASLSDSLSADGQLRGSRLRLRRDSQYTMEADFEGECTLSNSAARLVLASSLIEVGVGSDQLGINGQMLQAMGWGDTLAVSWQQRQAMTLSRSPGEAISVQGISGVLQASSGESSVTIDMETAELGLRPGTLESFILNSALTINGSFHSNQLPVLDGSVSLRGAADSNTQALELQFTERDGPLSFSITGSDILFDENTQYRADLTIDDMSGALASYAPLLPPGSVTVNLPQLTSGRMVLNTSARQVAEQWQWHSQVEIEQLSLTHETSTVDGLSLKAGWQGLGQWQTEEPALLAIERLDTGLQVQNLSARISLPRPTSPTAPELWIEALDMSLLGGRAFLPDPQSWNFASDQNNLALQVEDFELAEIVALQQNHTISAEGRLSGLLPMSFSGDRITISKGHILAAAPGGIIQYRPDGATTALAANSKELAMTMRLLDDFHYDVLSSEVTLDETGNLLLGLSLAGRNPGYEQGRAVNFNINLEQNIDPLLQSLRLGGSVVERLEKKRR